MKTGDFSTESFYLNATAYGCLNSFNTTMNRGQILWSYNLTSPFQDDCVCMLSLHVAPEAYIVATVELKWSSGCSPFVDTAAQLMNVFEQWPTSDPPLSSLLCNYAPLFNKIYTSTNRIYFRFVSCRIHAATFAIRFNTTTMYSKNTFEVVTSSSSSGYVMSPGYDGIFYCVTRLDISFSLMLPDSFSAVMISFQRLHVNVAPTCPAWLELSILNKNNSLSKMWQRCNQRELSAQLYFTSAIQLHIYNMLRMSLSLGFSMQYSFHKNNSLPHKYDNTLFNCSVDYYPSFQHHLQCNMDTECQDGRDETGDCPWSNQACDGKLVFGNKCLSVVKADMQDGDGIDNWNRICKERGGNLATIHTQADLDALAKLASFPKNSDRCNIYGLGMAFNHLSLPPMYRKIWTDVQRTVLYDVLAYRDDLLPLYDKYVEFKPYCQVLRVFGGRRLQDLKCDTAICGVLCENSMAGSFKKTSNEVISPLRMTNSAGQYDVLNNLQVLVTCPLQHLTHLFLSCDVKSQCGQSSHATTCNFPDAGSALFQTTPSRKPTNSARVEMFPCDNGLEIIHFTLVCNFHFDCQDQSDESFCRHPQCPQSTCTNGQCFPFNGRCDEVTHCLDQSDEMYCNEYGLGVSIFHTKSIHHALINLNRFGRFDDIPLAQNESCPDTHYLCPGLSHNCLPVYTRCNGFYDCLGREDEQGCDNMTCPGYYRCRGSAACVHLDHLCDGWSQCPQGDDEWLCEEKTCPKECICHGLAFVCSQPFSFSDFPSIRYLNGSRSGIGPDDLSFQSYLVFLALARCAIRHVPEINFPNMRHLDLSNNYIRTINMTLFLPLENLKFLSLSNNPLLEIITSPSRMKQSALRSIDLSGSSLTSFSSKPFANFLAVQYLNLSQSSISVINTDGFRHMPSLLKIDLSATPLKTFSADVFQGAKQLQQISSSSYKLCCNSVLPAQFLEHFCVAPADEVSSCDDLLRSGSYRGFLWLMSILAITGNMFCLVFRSLVQRTSTKSAFNLFVTCLSLADLVMGVYVSIIGGADLVFRGRYLHYDIVWMNSVVCTVAGFLSLLSSEVSALTVLLITLDRFIVLHFPFSRLHFKTRSATVACLTAWAAGMVMAIVPLLPQTEHWHFYRQTGICIPLPITRKDFQGRVYSVGVMIILNFVLFALIAVGQALIYWSVLKHSMTVDTTRKVRDAIIARRLITVAVTDFLCWFPICVCGLLALAGNTMPGEVNVAMAIFVLPLNSAFNPFLYTFNIVLEKRKRLEEERRMKMLQSTLVAEQAA